MRTTWNIKPEALLLVRSLAQQRRITEGEAASELIVSAVTGRKRRLKTRHGLPIISGRGVPVTLEEVKAALSDD
jgi:hypothetical protein